MTQKFHHDYPYRLRLQHPAYAELRLERRGRWIRVDPADAPAPEEIVLLTGAAPHRVRATVEAVRNGREPTVYAPAPLFDWLRGQGTVHGGPFPAEVDGVRIAALAYTPSRPATPLTALLRAPLRRLSGQARPPACDPHILSITFADGSRLLHLDLALHGGVSAEWVGRAVAAFGAPEWLVVGLPWGDSDALVEHLPGFSGGRVLVTELVNGERRELGLPTELVTPVRDRLVAVGVQAHVFATQTSYRFE